MPERTIEEMHKARTLLAEAARTVFLDGGDEWLANELRHESCRLGEGMLEALWENHRYIEYGEVSLSVARLYMACHDFSIALEYMADAEAILLDYEDTTDAKSEASTLLARIVAMREAVTHWVRVRSSPAAQKRERRRERRMMWRNAHTKQILRRVHLARLASATRRSERWYTVHGRINARADKLARRSRLK